MGWQSIPKNDRVGAARDAILAAGKGAPDMDFRVLARFVMILGVLFLAYAGYQYATNQPVKFDPAKSEPFLGGRNDIGNLLNVQGENMQREMNRQAASKPATWGAIFLFAGFAIFYSTRPTNPGSIDLGGR
jgi:hypothetical protein